MVELEREISETLQQADAEIEASPVERLEVALAAAREQNLRLQADFENWRKRVARESQELDHRIRGELIARLLPVLDNFERALEAAGVGNQGSGVRVQGAGGSEQEINDQPTTDHRPLTAHDPLVQGVRMVFDQLTFLLSEMGLTPLESVGQAFDPKLHEAVGTRVCADFPDGCIVEEHERGYRFGGEILRPAKVTIAVRA